MTRVASWFVLAGAMVLAVAATGSAQEPTKTSETKMFEIIAVAGNDLVVKLPEGTRELTVPEDFKFTVDGQQVSLHDLKPGMKGTATITTTTTVHPVTVTEVKNGTVMQVSGSSMMVRTDEGIKSFTEGDLAKRGVKMVRDGEPAEFSDFHKGDVLTATIITTKPPRVVTEKEVEASLAHSAPAADASGTHGAATHGAAAPAASEAHPPVATAGTMPAAHELPKTGSSRPLVGASGLMFLFLGLALTTWRSVLR